MFAGVSSKLLRYRDGILYIEISNLQSRVLSTFNTAVCYARNYRAFNPELKEATGFVVTFYDRENSPGGFVPATCPGEAFKALLERLREPENRKLHSIHKGWFVEGMEWIEKDLVEN